MTGMTAQDLILILTAVVTVIGAIGTAAVKIIMALKDVEMQVGGVDNKVSDVESKVMALEVKVDGRLSQLLERTADSSRAEGVVLGRAEILLPPGTEPAAPTAPAVATPVDKSKVDKTP